MARAKRHYIPGQIWHLTHRCHKRDFLLKFAKDRNRLLQWLFEAKKRYGLTILNYTVTSNHIHLLVVDDKGRNVIPDSIKLVAGRTGQEYNLRKNRKGAFWEDRYHATAIQSDSHLLSCLVYIDLNMVRNTVVSHPSQWAFGGYNEIQQPRRKCVLIDYQKLASITGFAGYDAFRKVHKDMIDESLGSGANVRNSQWTESIAVGSKSFVETIKGSMATRAQGREVRNNNGTFHLREKSETYITHFEAQKYDIGPQNTFFWKG
jgi:putative transposase